MHDSVDVTEGVSCACFARSFFLSLPVCLFISGKTLPHISVHAHVVAQVNYVVQEAIVVIRDIFRKYPNKYESIIGALCENLASLDEPEAKAAMIWIVGPCVWAAVVWVRIVRAWVWVGVGGYTNVGIQALVEKAISWRSLLLVRPVVAYLLSTPTFATGEYAERIDNADELLGSFLESFVDESSQVCGQVAHACQCEEALPAAEKCSCFRPCDTSASCLTRTQGSLHTHAGLHAHPCNGLL